MSMKELYNHVYYTINWYTDIEVHNTRDDRRKAQSQPQT